ncbi:hypothetical protein CY34DRAFT_300100 [Suillus luteus UH-Slu-Lm8-n1]|uniref:Uncharacterized protein n=1 Tax=Suillus luteus UH-Slu-Lm8-n1 TaxID=930992 RepID=A0A0D0AZY3_9AGAM|nr:hypothetical protein CY34DRAFT_300100 [Suillus luteus UH-Slu-Lm8-n1]
MFHVRNITAYLQVPSNRMTMISTCPLADVTPIFTSSWRKSNGDGDMQVGDSEQLDSNAISLRYQVKLVPVSRAPRQNNVKIQQFAAELTLVFTDCQCYSLASYVRLSDQHGPSSASELRCLQPSTTHL